MSADGRNIDLTRGILTGEASHQGSLEGAAREELSLHVSGQPAAEEYAQNTADPTYYGHPVLKKSVWSWSIPAYYYVGGATGASMALGAAATLLNRDGLPVLIRKSRWIGIFGATASAGLLIYDLGKPLLF